MRVSGSRVLGFRVSGLVFRIEGSRVFFCVSGLRVLGFSVSGFRVQGL